VQEKLAYDGHMPTLQSIVLIDKKGLQKLKKWIDKELEKE